MRNILLEKERRKKTLDIDTVNIELIATIRYSNKRTSSGKAILNYDVQCSHYKKPHNNNVMVLACVLQSQATGWINVVPEKDICALSSILSQPSSQLPLLPPCIHFVRNK